MNYPDPSIIPPEYTFTSTIGLPDGRRIEVTVSIPEHRAHKDIGETAEVVQMAVSRVLLNLRDGDQKVPF